MIMAEVRARQVSVLVASLALLWCVQVQADPRTDYLARLLQSSTQFRVRAQAAISLGRVASEPGVISVLSAALGDVHPAVRAAAASSLERLGDASALPALKRREGDAHEAVRAAVASAINALERSPATNLAAATTRPPDGRGNVVFYVGVGIPGSRVSGIDQATLISAQEFLRAHLRTLEGVELAPADEQPRQAEGVLRRRNLTGYFIDSSIVSIEERADGAVRASVSVIVGTYPGRDMRSILQGAATVMGGGSGARRQAIEAAFTGALRNLSQAMAAGRR